MGTRRKNIVAVPLSVVFGETEYKENIDITKERFFELLKTEKEMPRTSQPSPQDYIDLIEEARSNDVDIIIITISSALSGTGGERMVAEYAVRLRDEGKTAKEIVEKTTALRERVVLYTVMDTLEYLHRGEILRERLEKIGVSVLEERIIPVGAVVGTHIGPGACAVVYI